MGDQPGRTREADAGLDCPSRRGVLRSLATVGVSSIAAGVLVACSTENSRPVSATPADDAGADGAGSGDAGAEGGTTAGTVTEDEAEASIPLADVPVGQAVVVDAFGARFVVAQPTAGEVVAFSAACTHAGTPVEAVGGLELRCPNHGSRFDAGDGAAVLNGPAAEPLPTVASRVEGDLVVLSA